MTDNQRKLLQKELAFYTNLLKNHESQSDTVKLPSSTLQGPSSYWKRPLPACKTITNFSGTMESSKSQRLSNVTQMLKPNALNQNKRTVFYNQSKYFKGKPKITNEAFDSAKPPVNMFNNRQIIINGNISNSNKRTVLSTENSPNKAHISSRICKNNSSPHSEALLKELAFLTQLLKGSSESKSKSIPNLKIVSSDQNATINRNVLNNEASNKSNPLTHQMLNEREIASETLTVTLNLSPAHNKQNDMIKSNLNKGLSTFPIPNSPHSNKVSRGKFSAKQSLYSKTNHTLKFDKNEDVKSSISNKNILGKNVPSHIKVCKSKPFLEQSYNVSVKPNRLEQDRHILDRRFTFVKESSKHKIVNRKSPVVSKIKSPIVPKDKSLLIPKVKSPVTAKLPMKSGTVYSKINKKHIIGYKKNPLLRSNLIFRKSSPGCKVMKNVNSKYKIVNKSGTKSSENTLKQQSNSESNDNSGFDKSDPVIKLFDDTDIDKLEQALLAISTSLTTSPEPEAKRNICDKLLITASTKKVNSKFCLRRTPLKKCKVIFSKYKVVNKSTVSKINFKKTPSKKYKFLASNYKVVNKNLNTPQNLSFRISSNISKTSPKKSCKKFVLSKFAIVNKHSPLNVISPISKGKSVLVKRLYKSKSTIINKNRSPISHSARLIKSKYLGLNKRKFSNFPKHDMYPKMSLKLQRYKGYPATDRLLLKQNRYQSMSYNPLRVRRFTKHYNSITSGKYFKGYSGSASHKQKLNKRYGQSPVLLIRGTRYSLGSSGKTLKKLPSKGQTRTSKTPKRIVIGGKPYVRISESMMKATSPVSLNVASRVLHRSINRALTATTKKKLSKVNTYCMFYNRFGRCNRGVKCTFIHDPSKIAVCTRFLRGTCKIEGCPFSHEVAPGKMAICSFFLVGACEKDDCPYRHEQLSPNAALCKAFVQGYCPNGKECKKAHILICPKFILGECEKGSSCAFPHPPQKVKKNVQKDNIDDKDVEKPVDLLLEKVARYFQPLCETSQFKNTSVENDSSTLFVPIQRKLLEQQPAFIPLCDMPGTSRMKTE